VGETLTQREQELQNLARQVYQERLDAGVAREQARKDLPLSTYTEAYWKVDLHNLLHFLALRMDSHAQQEIRDYATVIGEQIVSRWVPMAWEAFLDYRFNGQSLSGIESAVIAAVGGGQLEEAVAIAKEKGLLTFGEDGQPKRNRERAELEAKLRQFNLTVPWPTI
jgi:thymidylate synthase (FAD)